MKARLATLILTIALLTGCGGGSGGGVSSGPTTIPAPTLNTFAPGSISGFVMSPTGQPVSGATVSASGSAVGLNLPQTTTAADGSFTLSNLPGDFVVAILVAPPAGSGLSSTVIPGVTPTPNATTPLPTPIQLTASNTNSSSGTGTGQVFTFGRAHIDVEISNDTGGFDTSGFPVRVQLLSCELIGSSPATFDTVFDNFVGAGSGTASFDNVQTPDPRDPQPFDYTIHTRWTATYQTGAQQNFSANKFIVIGGDASGQSFTEFFSLSSFDVPAAP